MREILYKKKSSLKHRTKSVFIEESSREKDCDTQVRKQFVYRLEKVRGIHRPEAVPQIFIRKFVDNARGVEHFSFRVRGFFYMTQNRIPLRVNFCHSLDIHIQWRTTELSPKGRAS